MKRRSAHEPKAKVMDAADVWDDARQVAAVLQGNLLKADSMVRLRIPLSAFLSALDNFSRRDLVLLRKRVEERLAT
jgi:hypothetical protein